MKQPDKDLIDRICTMAWQARAMAYAPYSGFAVGAALYLPAWDEIICGCNVENVSYGATICAERTAITSAVARFGKIEPACIAIAADFEPAISPCGMCLQVLAEFAPPTMPVYLVNKNGLRLSTTLEALLPRAFTDFGASGVRS